MHRPPAASTGQFERQPANRPTPAVGVHHPRAGEVVAGGPRHRVDQGGGPVGARLEERAGRDPPAPPGHLVVDPGPPARLSASAPDDQHVAGHHDAVGARVDHRQALARGGLPPAGSPRWPRRSRPRPAAPRANGWATRQRVGHAPRRGTGGGGSRPGRRPPRPARWCGSPRRQRPARPSPAGRRSRRAGAGASTTTAAFSAGCAAGTACCRSQPPQPWATSGQGGSMRSGEATHDLDQLGPGHPLARSVIRARTARPGSAPRTNTTRPSPARASASPPATSRVGPSSTTASRRRCRHRRRTAARSWPFGGVGGRHRAPSVGGYRRLAPRPTGSIAPEDHHAHLRPPEPVDPPRPRPRPSRSPRRCCPVDFAQLRRGVRRAGEGRRRPDPVRRHGRPLRAQPHLRSRRHRLAAPACHGALRGPPHGRGARPAGPPLRRGRLRAAHRPCRGLPPPAPRARRHRRAGRHRGASPSTRPRPPPTWPTSSTWSTWCWS